MKLKIYIVTYNNASDLNQNLESLWNSDAAQYETEIFIINNHSNFSLAPQFKDSVTVLHNSLRPDWSTGHLARNWNQALIHGFKNLDNPDAGIVITAQDDTLWLPNTFAKLLDAHCQYSFITAGHGDNVISYRPEAVSTIGLWDERFCTVCWQDADYFLRAYLLNAEESSMNDFYHPRKHNLLDTELIQRPPTNQNRKDARLSSNQQNDVCKNLFLDKWGNLELRHFENPLQHSWPTSCRLPQPITYPYFENTIPNLNEKFYYTSLEQQKQLLNHQLLTT